MRLLEKSYKEKNDFMNKLLLIGSCQQVAMINLSVVKSHVNKPCFLPIVSNTNRKKNHSTANRSIYISLIFSNTGCCVF